MDEELIDRLPKPGKLPKIWIFLNQTIGDQAQVAAVAEDGNCLAWIHLPAKVWQAGEKLLGQNSKNAKAYKAHYPHGYELLWIGDIRDPENHFLAQEIKRVTDERVERQNALVQRNREGRSLRHQFLKQQRRRKNGA